MPLGKTQQTFGIHADLFGRFPYSPISKGALVADVQLEKSETLLVVKAAISGTIELTCDRTDQLFDEPITVVERVVFQFGSQEVEHTEHLFEIPSGIAQLSLAELFYNMIITSIPMKKLHPDVRHQYHDQDGEGNLLIYTTATNDHDDEPADPSTNPFSQLLKLKNLN